MAEMPSDAAVELAVHARLILFRAASGTDWVHAGIPDEAATHTSYGAIN
jgi:hypothetical protein